MSGEQQFELDKALEFVIENHLKPYTSGLHHYSITNSENENTIEVLGQKTKDSNSRFTLIRIGINYNNGEVYISNIFVPMEDRRKGIGLSLISVIYQLVKKFDFALCLVDLTDSFREKMLSRNAEETNVFDALQITDNTNFK